MCTPRPNRTRRTGSSRRLADSPRQVRRDVSSIAQWERSCSTDKAKNESTCCTDRCRPGHSGPDTEGGSEPFPKMLLVSSGQFRTSGDLLRGVEVARQTERICEHLPRTAQTTRSRLRKIRSCDGKVAGHECPQPTHVLHLPRAIIRHRVDTSENRMVAQPKKPEG